RLHKNVYIDVAGLPPVKLLTYFPDMERFADKFVFGTDWPNVDVKKNIDAIRNLPIAAAAAEKILGENAKRLLQLD
ncbi:MAG: amidohydrolase family protein, partial [Sporomusa sp.]